jgi:phage terminase large subunit GpA-like protein
MRPPRMRTMREFAEQEIVIPNGPYVGEPFRVERQPFVGLLLDLLDDEWWDECWITGSQQAGKTLSAHVIPILYHLFERRETVIAAAPDDKTAADKWSEDILPCILRTRYASLLPKRGAGSNSGRVSVIRFSNGATLRFMTGGGGDKARAAFTARVIAVTETEAFDVTGGTSKEATKLDQIQGRRRAFTRETVPARGYYECTLTTSQGRTWAEYQSGSQTRIACPCPHCEEWVTPGRACLKGWQDADDELEARSSAHWVCPNCQRDITSRDRAQMNRNAVAVHRGQDVSGPANAPKVTGDRPATHALGFRWDAYNNLFTGAADVAVEEWKASRADDEENAKKKLLQWVWALPYDPPRLDLSGLEYSTLTKRQHGCEQGFVPDDVVRLVAALDLGNRICHYVVMGETGEGRRPIVDYGVVETTMDQIGLEAGLGVALHTFAELCAAGWKRADGEERVSPDVVPIDSGSGLHSDIVYAFVRATGEPFRASKGYGSLQQRRYREPGPEGKAHVVAVGTAHHAVWLPNDGLALWHLDADALKTRLHAALRGPTDQAGAITLPRRTPREHISIAKHLTAEKQERQFDPRRGEVTVWRPVRSSNHWLDCAAMCLAALEMEPYDDSPVGEESETDGRAWLAIDRRGG